MDELYHDSFSDLEKDYRHTHPVAWWMALTGPVVITAFVLGLVYVFQGPKVVSSYLAAAATAFFAAGRFIILLGANEPNAEGWGFLKYLDAQNLFVMLTYMDVIVAMFVAFHMGIVFRLPWVGPKIRDIVSDGHFILRKQPWIRRAAFVGLVGFVIFPTSTTGSVGGSIFGRLLGMKRWQVVMAILVGSILGNGLMLIFAKQISHYIDGDSWWLRIGGVAVMIIALFVIEHKFRGLKNEYLAQEQLNQKLESEKVTIAQPESDHKPASDVSSDKTSNPLA
ncbi:MAG: small multi-drug export protein [Mariniblastus sp.]